MNATTANFPASPWISHAISAVLGVRREHQRVAVHQSAAPARPALARGQTHWVDARAGTEVTCVDGCLWLTYDGQQRDIILERGQSHGSEGGRLSIHALERAEFLLRV